MIEQYKIIDLTHPLFKDIPTWNGSSDFELSIDIDYTDCTPPNLFRTQKITCSAGIGTHMDSPAHVIPGGRTIDQLLMDELAVDCVVIDVSHEASENYIIMPSVVEKLENEHGKISPNSLVIFYTGWSKYWETPDKYHNNHKFPSVHVSTANKLLEKNIVGFGIDTLSCDTGKDGFPAHQTILGGDKYLIENIANANLLPPTGAKIFVLPLKIKDATEAPIRLIGLI